MCLHTLDEADSLSHVVKNSLPKLHAEVDGNLSAGLKLQE